MRYKFITTLFFACFQLLFSQENIKTHLKTNDLTSVFSASSLQWSIPVSSSEKVNLQWYERKNSFTDKEGIRTFVGYEGDLFVATLSISKGGDDISGDFTWKEHQWKIATTNDGYLFISKEHSEGECGGCHNGHCGTHSDKKSLRGRLTARPEKNVRKIPTDNVLRVFRLAVLVDKYYYDRYYGSKDAVKSFWSRLEIALNEYYIREIGIKLQIVNDDRLIIDSSKEKVFDGELSNKILNKSTAKINELIGKDSYDAGIIISRNSDTNIAGLASVGAIRLNRIKARAMANNSSHIIAHELGHLFGSSHTFTVGGTGTYQTEPGKGQSIMSYGHPVNFFSLPSIYYIRRKISEIEHKITEIQTSNKAPIINKSKLKEEYTLPKETFFQFTVDATDPDNDPLLYAFHQADMNISNAEFESEKSTDKNTKAFYNHREMGTFAKKEYNFSSGKVYTFWLGVNDTKNTFDERLNHPTRYDMYETKVKFVEGNPFKITNFQRKYKTGEKVTLTWDVDPTLFQNTKVRILLSDDFGQTFNHILVPETENDGSCEIVMPNTPIGRKVHYQVNGNPIFHSGLGLIKIEVLDHVAFALTDNDITTGKGGFEVEASAITFTKTPTKYLKVSDEKDIPNEPIEAVSNCTADGKTQITLNEVKNQNFITRIWIATDNCRNTSSFVQHIEIQATTPKDLVFTKTPEVFLSATCNAVPSADYSQFATDGCDSVNITHQDTRKGNNCNYTIERVYTATGCKQNLIFTQTISVRDDKAPTFKEPLPTDISVEEGDIPEQIDLSATDNCSENIQVTKSQENKEENGNKVIIYKWEASDDCGNKVTHEQKVTVISSKIEFTGDLPKDLTISCEKEIPSVPTLQVSGNCNPKVVYNGETKSNEKCKNDYVLTRSWTATNDCGKSITHTQTITIKDDVKPAFSGTLPANISVEENKIPEQMDLTATDNCSEKVQVIKSKEEKQEGENKVITYKWEASDDCGNKVTHEQKVTVISSKIEFTGDLPKDMTISCEKEIPSVPTLQVSGNCNPKVVYNGETKSNEKCKNDYVITRSWTATNDCGKSIIHTQTITIKDDVKPVFSGTLPADISVEENKIPEQMDLTATDNCSEKVQVIKSKEEKQEGENKVITYKWEASDDCGNKVTHEQKVTVISSKIEFTGDLPKDMTISCGKEIPSAPTLQVSGNCNPKLTYNGETKSNEKCKNDYTLTRSWTATNDCGKSIIHTQIITIKDDKAPTFNESLPTDVSVEESEVLIQVDLTATDNCSENIQVTKTQENKEENGNKVIIYKWEASDECGNKVFHEQKITIQKSSEKITVYNGVSTESGSENYLKIEPIENYKNLQIEIFNELGQKVYESKNYQKNGEVFRGYANVKGVFRKGKRLPTGTYFYVLKYQDITGKSNTKQGYLFVR